MRRVHVLHIIDGLKVGGAEVLLLDLVRGLLSLGYRVSICYSTPGPLQSEFSGLGIQMSRLRRLARLDPLLLVGMCRTIRRDPPQIVHTHLFKSDMHGRLAGRLSGVPVVTSTLHSMDAWAESSLLGRVYGATARWAERLIAVSEEVRRYHIERTGVAADKVCTIPNGVRLERFSGQDRAGLALRRELGVKQDCPLVAIVGALKPAKDHASFLRAAARIRQALPQARFLVVGDGPLRGQLEDQAASLGLGSAIVFCGLRRDIPEVLAAVDLLVFSSRWEGLPVSLLEGMAAACPVVATAVGGIPGVIVDQSTGRLVPPGEPDALAAACLSLLEHPEWSRELGMAGQARVAAEYSMGAMVRRTSELYQELLDRASGDRRTP
jgi:glycosyltransferase involved in cell wall biosynthesis